MSSDFWLLPLAKTADYFVVDRYFFFAALQLTKGDGLVYQRHRNLFRDFWLLPLAKTADYFVIALCETTKGVINAGTIAEAPNVVALMWGAEDLVASLGGTSSRFPDGRYRDVATHARSTVLLAAGGNGKAAVDSIYANIPDLEGLRAEAADAVASGFTAKACGDA